jgi:Family of unknown function (DUF6064)
LSPSRSNLQTGLDREFANETEVELPFTSDEFFGVFADYNRQFWWMAMAWWFGNLAALVLAWRRPTNGSGALSYFLGALWLWNGLAYHALLFTRINPAAWLFAALFAVQAVFFFQAAAHSHLEYFASVGWVRALGIGLIAYGLAYPWLTMAFGHGYPAAPTFGVPCPTAILTIGALVTARSAAPVRLAIIPVFWSLVGGSAAVLLAVPTDYVLLAAGPLLAVLSFDRKNAG